MEVMKTSEKDGTGCIDLNQNFNQLMLKLLLLQFLVPGNSLSSCWFSIFHWGVKRKKLDKSLWKQALTSTNAGGTAWCPRRPECTMAIQTSWTRCQTVEFFSDFPSSSNNGKEHLVATKHARCGCAFLIVRPKSFLAAGVHDAAGRRVQGYQNLEPFRGEREHLDFGGRWQVVQQISNHWTSTHCIMGCCMMSLRGVQVGNREWDVSRWQSTTVVQMYPC